MPLRISVNASQPYSSISTIVDCCFQLSPLISKSRQRTSTSTNSATKLLKTTPHAAIIANPVSGEAFNWTVLDSFGRLLIRHARPPSKVGCVENGGRARTLSPFVILRFHFDCVFGDFAGATRTRFRPMLRVRSSVGNGHHLEHQKERQPAGRRERVPQVVGRTARRERRHGNCVKEIKSRRVQRPNISRRKRV